MGVTPTVIENEIKTDRAQHYSNGDRSNYARKRLRQSNSDFHIDIAEQLKYERHEQKNKRIAKETHRLERKSKDILGSEQIPKRIKLRRSRTQRSLLQGFDSLK